MLACVHVMQERMWDPSFIAWQLIKKVCFLFVHFKFASWNSHLYLGCFRYCTVWLFEVGKGLIRIFIKSFKEGAYVSNNTCTLALQPFTSKFFSGWTQKQKICLWKQEAAFPISVHVTSLYERKWANGMTGSGGYPCIWLIHRKYVRMFRHNENRYGKCRKYAIRNVSYFALRATVEP